MEQQEIEKALKVNVLFCVVRDAVSQIAKKKGWNLDGAKIDSIVANKIVSYGTKEA